MSPNLKPFQHPTSAEAIIHAGLNYMVEKLPLFTYDSENSKGETDLMIPEIEVPKYYATIRTDIDEVLGVVGKDYNAVQNVDAFSFFDAIVGGERLNKLNTSLPEGIICVCQF